MKETIVVCPACMSGNLELEYVIVQPRVNCIDCGRRFVMNLVEMETGKSWSEFATENLRGKKHEKR